MRRPTPPRLRPGLYVVRRDDRHLQVGLDPPARLVVPDRPDLRALLDDLVAGHPLDLRTGAAQWLARSLAAAGLLQVDAPTPPRPTVSVAGAGPLAVEATRLLGAAGVPVAHGESAGVALVLADGEPPRDLVDDHVRDGRDHLVVSADAAGYRVGPFVRPGVTACLRCVDAHRGERDPRRAVVVEQLAGRPLAAPDPALRALAVSWAVRDLLGHLDGRTPASWSAEVALDDGPLPRRTPWTRHPHCGCTWADGLTATDRAVSNE
ncbi:hypothetical protein [Nocardioides mangrovi]|uniref:TOMM leader peptide-binding protein n=1 Tax=Nocardioides mangrovi TaxID=2874580 RepID=A0ABS7UI30_9ACTN|nr:hypothetical protein [Nocardioides mangrovi]MBZ5740680.1 hypothetical protein [Nocardioides mangrovi]